MGVFRSFLSFDRTHDKFYVPGQTDFDIGGTDSKQILQLKGRDREIKLSLAMGTLYALAAVSYFLTGGWGGAYFFGSATALVAVIALKEAAIQSVARSKEKEDFGFEDSSNTLYLVSDFRHEVSQMIRRVQNTCGKVLQLSSHCSKREVFDIEVDEF